MEKFDPKLLEFATDRQRELLEAWERLGSQQAAADHFKVDHRQVSKAYTAVKRKAALKHVGIADYGKIGEIPEGLTSNGISALKNGRTGEVLQVWDKAKPEGLPVDEALKPEDYMTLQRLSTMTTPDGVRAQWASYAPNLVARQQLWKDWAEGLKDEIPRYSPAVPTVHSNFRDDLLALYPIGDHHLGMLAWDKETGADYDLKIGERLLTDAVDYLVEAAPTSRDALLMVLGDFLHYDGFAAVTPTSKHVLDSDTRFPKMARTAVRSLRATVARLLEKHENVRIILEIGNHDLASSVWLMVSLEAYYENEPRVTVDISPKHYHYHRFGKVLLASHHGHGTKPTQLPGIMANDVPDDWGATVHRYWHIGHLHHMARWDMVGCTVEQHRVLATQDAWAAQKGYRSQRDMKQITYHREYGEVSRNTVNPEMFGG